MERSTILLVDDNAQILGILAELLKPLGHTTLSALGGYEALEIAATTRLDLVLLDVLMPGMDGFTVCQRLRSDAQLAQVPVIFVTALDDRASRVRGFEAGADEFISKPFDHVELRTRVSSILRLNRYRRLLDEQARVAAERARFVWAVEHADDGVLILGPDDHLRYANPRACQMLSLNTAALGELPFLALAVQQFKLTPAEAWSSWPEPISAEVPRYLVRPESRTAGERWLVVELLPPSVGDDARVLRLRDVTEQITSQREMWTFHAMLGHKLRTPLVGILGGLNILHGGATTMDRDSIARIVDVSLAGARRLRAAIEDILHYLRPPADVYGVEGFIVANLAALIAQLGGELQVAQLAVDYAPALAERRLAVSRHGVEVVLREVLENCVKFHPNHQPAIDVELFLGAPNELHICVGDDGAGLPPEQLTLAWRPYYQGERSFTGQIEGMGLGLALVARIVYAVGGHCELANRTDRQGAAVTLVLPLLEG